MNKVFVYGILKRGSMKAILNDYDMFYRGHATIKAKENGVVYGELLKISDEELAHFDIIEGVAQNYYHRFKVDVVDEEGIVHGGVWVYQQTEDKENE